MKISPHAQLADMKTRRQAAIDSGYGIVPVSSRRWIVICRQPSTVSRGGVVVLEYSVMSDALPYDEAFNLCAYLSEESNK